jgi:hypothetical protein
MSSQLEPQTREDLVNPKDRSFTQRLATAADWRSAILIPFLAVFSALVIGLVIIILTGSSFA